MKRLLLAVIAALPMFAAGTCTVTQARQISPVANTWSATLVCIGDASTGSYPATAIAGLESTAKQLQGFYVTSVTITPGTTAPTASYAATIKNDAGVDQFQGTLAGLSATAVASFPATRVATPISGVLTVAITGNSVASAQTTFQVFFAPNPVTAVGFKLIAAAAVITASNCAVGDEAFATDATAGSNIYLCTATNTWTQASGGGGTTYTAGSGIDVTSTVISTTTLCHSYSSSDQLLASSGSGIGYFATHCAIPANTLNAAGNTIEIILQLVATTTTTSTPVMGFTIDLCTVSGCGSGSVVDLIADQSFATALGASQTNKPVRLQINGLITNFSTPTATILPEGFGVSFIASTSNAWNGLGLISATGTTTFDATAIQYISVKQTRTFVTGQTVNLLGMTVRIAK